MGDDTDDSDLQINSQEIAQQVIIITGIITLISSFFLTGTTRMIVFGLAPIIALSSGFIAYSYIEIKYGDGLSA